MFGLKTQGLPIYPGVLMTPLFHKDANVVVAETVAEHIPPNQVFCRSYARELRDEPSSQSRLPCGWRVILAQLCAGSC